MIAIHCHDTFGQALANILMALEVIIYIYLAVYCLFRWELGLWTLVAQALADVLTLQARQEMSQPKISCICLTA